MDDRLATIDMGRILGGLCPLFRGGVGLQRNVAWSEAYLRTKWHLDPSSRLATIDMGRKLRALPPFWWRGAGYPSNTMLLGSRPTSLPSGILILRAIWPQQIGAENWEGVPLWRWGS